MFVSLRASIQVEEDDDREVKRSIFGGLAG
jgi:hypothetical protein